MPLVREDSERLWLLLFKSASRRDVTLSRNAERVRGRLQISSLTVRQPEEGLILKPKLWLWGGNSIENRTRQARGVRGS